MTPAAWTLVLLTAAAAAVPLLWWPPTPVRWTPRRVRRHPAARAGAAAGVPEALDLLALALQGGSSLGSASRQVASVLPPPLRDELDGVGQDLMLGLDPAPSWEAAGPRWRAARLSMEIAALAGVAPGPALRQAATDLRRHAVARVEVATARLGVRLVVPLGLAFLPGFVLSTVVPLVLALVRDLSW